MVLSMSACSRGARLPPPRHVTHVPCLLAPPPHAFFFSEEGKKSTGKSCTKLESKQQFHVKFAGITQIVDRPAPPGRGIAQRLLGGGGGGGARLYRVEVGPLCGASVSLNRWGSSRAALRGRWPLDDAYRGFRGKRSNVGFVLLCAYVRVLYFRGRTVPLAGRSTSADPLSSSSLAIEVSMLCPRAPKNSIANAVPTVCDNPPNWTQVELVIGLAPPARGCIPRLPARAVPAATVATAGPALSSWRVISATLTPMTCGCVRVPMLSRRYIQGLMQRAASDHFGHRGGGGRGSG